MPDERYDEHKKSSDFIKEYIFPGACIPSLSRITSAMASASRLSVEHLENIGNHYYQTLQCWRKKFMENQSKIVALGFDEKFIRTWEYYFEYCAAGFKSRTLGDYQIVFTRPGNVAAFSNSYQSVPSGEFILFPMEIPNLHINGRSWSSSPSRSKIALGCYLPFHLK